MGRTIGQTLSFITSEGFLEGGNVPISSAKNCIGTLVYFTYRNNRVWISADFRDLKSGNRIATIEYNHWRLYLEKKVRFYNDDSRLEVRDYDDNIVCSISTLGKRGLDVAGYFLNPDFVYVLGNNPGKNIDTCIPKTHRDWMGVALRNLESVSTIFPTKTPF